MLRLKPIIAGAACQTFFNYEQAVEAVVNANRDGKPWDVRVGIGSTQRERSMTEGEAARFIQDVTASILETR